ncbi:MAG: HAD family phosphatase [Nitrospirae bacterium]|nr:HAD family phosphatase [Nitrospirota bacterium]
MVKAIIFDFGGVLAEEGFRTGLKAVAEKNGLAPGEFFRTADDLIYKTGYVTGMSDEVFYLNKLREETGIKESNEEIKHEILTRFILRPEVIDYVGRLRSDGFITAILSDQTNWLEELNQRNHFFHHFDYVFNSFRLKKGKRDPSIFRDVCSIIGLQPEETVFVDDNINNVTLALGERLNAILFQDIKELKMELKKYLT